MRVLMLLENQFPPDERVEKEIRTLKNSGYEVDLACAARTDQPMNEQYKGFSIFRLKIDPLYYKLSVLVLIYPGYLGKWYRFVEELHKKNHYDIIHVHDLPLSKVGLKLKKKYGTRVVCDQHEYYSNWIIETAHYNTLPGRMVKLFSNWKKYERKSLQSCDLIVTVEQPLKDEYISEYGLPEEKLITLPNTPEKTVFHESNVHPDKFSEYADQFMLLYFGGIDILRGLDNVIRAIPEIISEVPDFKFVIAGRKYGGYDPELTAREVGVEEYLDFLGWLDLELIPSLIHQSNLGIFVPPSQRKEINQTIATKNYQFLVMKKPMIVGKAKYMKDFTEKLQVGISVDEGNPGEIASAIIRIANDKVFRNQLLDKCDRIGRNYYWEQTSEELVSAYQRLLK